MSAIAPIKVSSILDLTAALKTADAAIGVDSTYDPEGFIQPGLVRWVDRSGGIAIGYPSFTLSVRPPTKTSRVYKVTAKLVSPTLEETSASTATGIPPPPVKAYDLTTVVEVMLPERSSLAERKAHLRRLASLMFATITASDGSPSDSTASPLISAIETFETVY